MNKLLTIHSRAAASDTFARKESFDHQKVVGSKQVETSVSSTNSPGVK